MTILILDLSAWNVTRNLAQNTLIKRWKDISDFELNEFHEFSVPNFREFHIKLDCFDKRKIVLDLID